ncbi:MAG: RICIN domain-containing protein [Gemmatimonadetes bacterium]|nr:RICIN domain-containing protein [Gemmatimonadota bacterium]
MNQGRILWAAAAAVLAVAEPARAQSPQIAEISPGSIEVGAPDFTLVIRGVGFLPGVSRVQFNGAAVPAQSITPTEIRAQVSSEYFSRSPFINERRFQDGIYRTSLIVINGPESGAPNARRVFQIVKPGAAAAPSFNPPIVTGVSPSPAQVGGTVIVSGDNFRAATAGSGPDLMLVELVNPHGNRYEAEVVARSRTEMQLNLSRVPEGTYAVELEANNSGRRGRTTAPMKLIVGAPTALGPATIAEFGPNPVSTRGGTLWIGGENFADDAEVTLVPPAGAGSPQVLARAPNQRQSISRLYVTLPALTYPGTYTLRVANPGGPVAEIPLAIQHTEQAQIDRARRGPGDRPGSPRERPRRAGAEVQYRTAITNVVHTSNGQRVLCLVPTGTENGSPVVLRGCHNGGAQYRLFNGYISTANNTCLDYGDEGGPIHLMDCKPGMPGGTSQQWYLHGAGGQMKLQNALNTNICMDVSGEGNTEGTPIIAYGCKFGQNAPNQMFNAGEAMSPLQLALIGMSTEALQQYTALSQQHGGAAQMIFDNGMHVVAAGGANVVAAGGGNVVAAGGLNVVAPGGANAVAAGGLNLINISANGVVAPGGANVVAAGGLNLLGGARVVAAGGLN